ncbi:hypothetical protein FA95DRAFT_303116 [Auriscalpium vulgare]|uniref:Uncharacterized protein n=1 Tax=Auriscalpium vulgare TaxID=40419 RepID=A0ACB8RKM9_9AGAM|nr:hypothetical protein FA95DRAFT_303116 [Auriscalpium vulgare]
MSQAFHLGESAATGAMAMSIVWLGYVVHRFWVCLLTLEPMRVFRTGENRVKWLEDESSAFSENEADAAVAMTEGDVETQTVRPRKGNEPRPTRDQPPRLSLCLLFPHFLEHLFRSPSGQTARSHQYRCQSAPRFMLNWISPFSLQCLKIGDGSLVNPAPQGQVDTKTPG